MEPVVNPEFCDWRVQSQGNCEGSTYVSFLYTTHIISSFLFLFISVGILIHNIWWKGQKIWEFSRNDRAFRPRPTEGFVLWCAGYFFCKFGKEGGERGGAVPQSGTAFRWHDLTNTTIYQTTQSDVYSLSCSWWMSMREGVATLRTL